MADRAVPVLENLGLTLAARSDGCCPDARRGGRPVGQATWRRNPCVPPSDETGVLADYSWRACSAELRRIQRSGSRLLRRLVIVRLAADADIHAKCGDA